MLEKALAINLKRDFVLWLRQERVPIPVRNSLQLLAGQFDLDQPFAETANRFVENSCGSQRIVKSDESSFLANIHKPVSNTARNLTLLLLVGYSIAYN